MNKEKGKGEIDMGKGVGEGGEGGDRGRKERGA